MEGRLAKRALHFKLPICCFPLIDKSRNQMTFLYTYVICPGKGSMYDDGCTTSSSNKSVGIQRQAAGDLAAAAPAGW